MEDSDAPQMNCATKLRAGSGSVAEFEPGRAATAGIAQASWVANCVAEEVTAREDAQVEQEALD